MALSAALEVTISLSQQELELLESIALEFGANLKDFAKVCLLERLEDYVQLHEHFEDVRDDPDGGGLLND